jgi:hypothetical protein
MKNGAAAATGNWVGSQHPEAQYLAIRPNVIRKLFYATAANATK